MICPCCGKNITPGTMHRVQRKSRHQKWIVVIVPSNRICPVVVKYNHWYEGEADNRSRSEVFTEALATIELPPERPTRRIPETRTPIQKMHPTGRLQFAVLDLLGQSQDWISRAEIQRALHTKEWRITKTMRSLVKMGSVEEKCEVQPNKAGKLYYRRRDANRG